MNTTLDPTFAAALRSQLVALPSLPPPPFATSRRVHLGWRPWRRIAW